MSVLTGVVVPRALDPGRPVAIICWDGFPTVVTIIGLGIPEEFEDVISMHDTGPSSHSTPVRQDFNKTVAK